MIISNSDLRWLDYLIIRSPRLKSLKKLIQKHPEYFTIITYQGRLLICVENTISAITGEIRVKNTPIQIWHRSFDKTIYTVYKSSYKHNHKHNRGFNTIDDQIVYKIIKWFTSLERNIEIIELGRSISDLTI